jgi:4-amino-4-deoxy-L-arabinose transferase-like glycosyltransferase
MFAKQVEMKPRTANRYKRRSVFRERLTALIGQGYFVTASLVSAAAVRLLWISLVHAPQTVDWLWYYQSGVSIASGHGYSFNGIPTAFWPVGYPGFLAGIFYLLGPHVFAGQIANIVECLGTILLTYHFIKTVFHSETAARIAVLILSFQPNNIAYTSLLTADMFLTLLLVLGAFLFVSARGRWGFLILSGLVWGLATLTKPQAIVVPAIFLLAFGAEKQSILKLGTVLYLMVLAVVAPWIARNYRVFGVPVLSTNGGITLLFGNNPYATGRTPVFGSPNDPLALLGDLDPRDPTQPFDPKQLFDGREVARDHRARYLALDYIRYHPASVVALWPRKFMVLYRSDVDGFYYTLGLKNDLGRKTRVVYVGLKVIAELYYLVMILLFVFSLPVVLQRGRAANPIGLLICSYFTLLSVVFIGDPRYHLALMPWIAMYSGIGAAILIGKGIEFRWENYWMGRTDAG